MNETYIIPTVADEFEELPPEDDALQLAEEGARRRREGRADDIIAMQAALCILIAVGVIVTNIFQPDIAETLFEKLRQLAESKTELFPNPIGLIAEYFGK